MGGSSNVSMPSLDSPPADDDDGTFSWKGHPALSTVRTNHNNTCMYRALCDAMDARVRLGQPGRSPIFSGFSAKRLLWMENDWILDPSGGKRLCVMGHFAGQDIDLPLRHKDREPARYLLESCEAITLDNPEAVLMAKKALMEGGPIVGKIPICQDYLNDGTYLAEGPRVFKRFFVDPKSRPVVPDDCSSTSISGDDEATTSGKDKEEEIPDSSNTLLSGDDEAAAAAAAAAALGTADEKGKQVEMLDCPSPSLPGGDHDDATALETADGKGKEVEMLDCPSPSLPGGDHDDAAAMETADGKGKEMEILDCTSPSLPGGDHDDAAALETADGKGKEMEMLDCTSPSLPGGDHDDAAAMETADGKGKEEGELDSQVTKAGRRVLDPTTKGYKYHAVCIIGFRTVDGRECFELQENQGTGWFDFGYRDVTVKVTEEAYVPVVKEVGN